ncbi:hypothetical protein KCE64_005421, partial [Salmonella enterica subsp. enterica serovar Hvittingfoss]|nr:hypothetical protein [Salmonella enterica subsp. enterica serovar Hvittingfoss]
MAVENKFKLNVIAASVLMGLSLSAMAESGTSSTTTTPAETTPAKPATLAGLAAPVKDDAVTVTVKSVSGDGITKGAGTLKAILSEKSEGSVSKTHNALTAAQHTYDTLGKSSQELITRFKDATTGKNQATQVWNDFGNKLSAANSVYADSLHSMYGDERNNAFTVNTSGVPVAEATKKDPSTYGKLLSAYDGLKTSVENLNKAIVGDRPTGYGEGALNVFANGTSDNVKEAAQKAEAQVFVYSNYINKALDVKTKELQLESVRNIVINNISTVLGQTDKTDGVGVTTNGVGKNLKDFKDAYEKWNQATSPADKATAETKLATAFQVLVKTTGINGVTGSSTAEGVKFDNLATAWVTLTGSGDGSVTKAQKDMEQAKDFASTGAGTPHDLFDAFTKSGDHAANVFTKITDLANADLVAPDSLNDALKKLQAAYLVLLGKDGAGNGASSTELENLNNLLETARQAHQTLSTVQADYTQKKLALQQAGTARLNLLLNELPGQQQKFLKAWTDYQDAKGNVVKDKSAKDAWDSLYGDSYNGGTATGALGAYTASLKATSEGIQGALDTAASDYKSIADDKSKTQEAKNTALYTLIGKQKTLTGIKLKLDTAYLNVLKKGVPADISPLVNNIKSLDTLKADLNTAATNKAEAKAQYVDAVKAYRDADKAYQTSKSEADAATLATAKANLMTVVGITSQSDFSKLYVTSGKPEEGFKSFDELSKVNDLSTDKSDVFSKYNTALEALTTTNGGGTEIQQARKAVVDSMNKLVSLMPLSTPEEQVGYRTAYNDALNEVGVQLASVDEQSKAPGAGKVTHILGSLTNKEIAQYNPVSGNYNSVIINVDNKDNKATGVKDSFTANDLYTGTQDNPFTTTVLDVRALELGNGELAAPNTITVGEAVTKDKKATPVEVWAKTAGTADVAKPAVKLSGNLRTATAQLDADGNPITGEVVRGADQIHLQNVNIHNNFTLADRTKMLADDMAAITSKAAEMKLLGQPADGEKGVDAWQKEQTHLLNSKYDNLKLTGLQIDTTTVNPSFELA